MKLTKQGGTTAAALLGAGLLLTITPIGAGIVQTIGMLDRKLVIVLAVIAVAGCLLLVPTKNTEHAPFTHTEDHEQDTLSYKADDIGSSFGSISLSSIAVAVTGFVAGLLTLWL